MDNHYFPSDCETPLECLTRFKELTGNTHPMLASDLKELICTWIDDNIYTMI